MGVLTRAAARPAAPGDDRAPAVEPVSEQIQRWLDAPGGKTLGGLIAFIEEKSFTLLFVLLLGVPALPLPTGGATHVFEVVAMLLALQLIAGRDEVWLPRRWRRIDLAGPARRRFLGSLVGAIRFLERFSRPRLRFLFGHRLSDIVFGSATLGGSLAAFLAPPFTGLDTLPALGVVLISLGVLLEDFLVVAAGAVTGVAGVALALLLGGAALRGLESLF
ncbi:MAG: exopolysaccharide biosynthesis protein [Solirubrobacterales bacterium]